MIDRQDHWQEDLFVAGPLSSLIPEDHILNQVVKCPGDRILTRSTQDVRGWVRVRKFNGRL